LKIGIAAFLPMGRCLEELHGHFIKAAVLKGDASQIIPKLSRGATGQPLS